MVSIGILILLFFTFNYYVIETNDDQYDIEENLTVQVSSQTNQYVPYEDIPEDLINAVIAVEDQRFFKHSGFDIIGFGRAFLTNIKEGSIEQGGSTITQQLAKNLFLTPEQSISRKVEELFLAWELERNYEKEEIMEMYLNSSYLGAGAYGIYDASYAFFDKDVRELTLEECATIVGSLKGPSIYNPVEHPDASQERQEIVLRLMEDNGYIK